MQDTDMKQVHMKSVSSKLISRSRNTIRVRFLRPRSCSGWVFDPTEHFESLNLVRVPDQFLAQRQFGTILQRLGQMYRLDLFTPRKIRNGARQFQDAMVRPRG